MIQAETTVLRLLYFLFTFLLPLYLLTYFWLLSDTRSMYQLQTPTSRRHRRHGDVTQPGRDVTEAGAT